MGYINKAIRELIEEMEDTFILPRNWNEYLYEVEKNNNIIIKNKNIYFCTNCQQSFNLNNGPKLKEETICPHCKQKYTVRSNRLKNYSIKDNILLLDKAKGQLIVRVFELRSDYISEKQEFTHSVVEYSRLIVDDDYRELRNDRITPGITSYCVNHYREDDGKWRLYTGYWYQTYAKGFFYKDNLKEVLKETIYEKSRLWDFVRQPASKYYNVKDLLYMASQPSFEVLVEMQLYNLAEYASSFWCVGSFKKIFGVSKDYYQFMKKHDITKEQLEVLRIYPTKDIRKINFLCKHKYVIEEIKEYTSLDNFIKYFRTKKLKDSHIYKDYLGFAKKLGLDLKNKKYLFPAKLKTMHDLYEKQIKIMEQERITKCIEKRLETLMKNVFKNNEFIIFPASSVAELVEESKQQNNCVRTYAERYADGNCDIYFMRKIDTPNISLVTVEVRNNKVVQKRTKNNEKTNKKQDKFLDTWQKKVLERVAV